MLLYKLTGRLPNPDLTAQHSCDKGGSSYKREPTRYSCRFLPSLVATGEGLGMGAVLRNSVTIVIVKESGTVILS